MTIFTKRIRKLAFVSLVLGSGFLSFLPLFSSNTRLASACITSTSVEKTINSQEKPQKTPKFIVSDVRLKEE